jgi:hypothetical protein
MDKCVSHLHKANSNHIHGEGVFQITKEYYILRENFLPFLKVHTPWYIHEIHVNFLQRDLKIGPTWIRTTYPKGISSSLGINGEAIMSRLVNRQYHEIGNTDIP